MKLLGDAFEYNAWATLQLGGVCRRLSAPQLTGQQEWQYRSILGLWQHIDEVERGYLRLMGAATLPEPGASLDGYLDSAGACGAAFASFAAGLDDAALGRMFTVPWFERDFTVADGLFQVVTHSIQHRADIAHFLSRLGYDTPAIDYIAWIYLRDGGTLPG
jgi:uncharacterized damage-inducible protein DinB